MPRPSAGQCRPLVTIRWHLSGFSPVSPSPVSLRCRTIRQRERHRGRQSHRGSNRESQRGKQKERQRGRHRETERERGKVSHMNKKRREGERGKGRGEIKS